MVKSKTPSTSFFEYNQYNLIRRDLLTWVSAMYNPTHKNFEMEMKILLKDNISKYIALFTIRLPNLYVLT